MEFKRLILLFGILWSILVLSSCSTGSKEVKQNVAVEIVEEPDEEDQSDIFAIPLDTSEEEEKEEERELQLIQENLKKRESQPSKS